jgi:hypothetical protein
VELGSLEGVDRDLQRAREEPQGLHVRVERRGPFTSRAQRQARLGGQRIGLRACGRGLVGQQVVVGDDGRDLLAAGSLEVAHGGQVSGAPLGSGEGPVRHLLEEALDEGVLPALGRARVDIETQDLAPNEPGEAGRELGRIGPADRREAAGGERLTEDRGVPDERPIGRLERVQAGRDEPTQGVRDLEGCRVADEPVAASRIGDENALADQHAHRLHGVQGHALGAPRDACGQPVGDTGRQSGEQLAHDVVRERLEVKRGEVALAGAPCGPTLHDLGSGQRDDEDGM